MAIDIPAPANKDVIDKLAQIVGEDAVSVSPIHRLNYSRDMYPVSLMHVTEGRQKHFPDVIVWPSDAEQVSRILKLAPELGLPVIPFGAGSGVCGGTLPIRGGIILDMKRMSRILEVNDEDLTVTAQAGIMGQTLEMELERRGYTMGHFPSSIYCSTLGGWVAARSAGQMSSKYGKIEDMVLALEFVLPDGGIIRTAFAPRSSTGPDWKQLFIGSEGTLGVATAATCRIWPAPEARRFAAFTFPDTHAGIVAMRAIMRNGLRPAVMRVYDPLDTVLVGGKGAEEDSGTSIADYIPVQEISRRIRTFAPKMVNRAMRTVSRWADVVNKIDFIAKEGCLMVLVFEGEDRLSKNEFETAITICERLGGRNDGPEPALKWYKNRYHVSYKMSKIFYNGAFVDTIEVATTWDRVGRLYDEVRSAIMPLAFIMAHFSHAYQEGCSIYFTFITSARDSVEGETVHAKVWKAAMEATIRVGATISHHHGVGLSKARYMREELGDMMLVFQMLKEEIDPQQQLNPGKLGL